MPTENTVRVSLRLKADVHAAVLQEASDASVDPAGFIQTLIENAVMHRLTDERRKQLVDTNLLYACAQSIARKLFEEGDFDENFTLRVIQRLLADPKSKSLYLTAIDAADPVGDVPGKSPVNMYLGWYIKNAVPARPVLDQNGKPKRAFVKNEAIKSYTLLRLE